MLFNDGPQPRPVLGRRALAAEHRPQRRPPSAALSAVLLAIVITGFAGSGSAQALTRMAVPSTQEPAAFAPLPYGPDTCRQGYVWREATPTDHVCVTPATRGQTRDDNSQAASRRQPGGGAYGPNTCRQGYVWREALPGDQVCVTPATRTQAARDNAIAANRRATGPEPCTAPVYGLIGNRWNSLGGRQGKLGCPLSPEHDAGQGGRVQRFERGSIVWSPRQGHSMVVSGYETQGSVVLEWGPTDPHSYSRFLVRWDRDGRNLGQRQVWQNPRTGTFTIGLPRGTYSFIVEGCNKPLFGSSECYQGWTLPVVVDVTTDAAAPPPRPAPAPAPAQNGIERLELFNCITERRTLYAWLNDGTQWRQVGSFDPAYDENGTCPGYGAEPFDINLDNGRQYLVVLVDTGAIGCGGNDPKTAACQKQSFTATGRTGGSTVRLSIPHTG
jgi:LGFP repeat